MILNRLLSQSIRMDQLPCIYSDGDIGTVRRIVESGVDINKKYGNSHETLLHTAALNNCLEIVKYLVESGADINQPDRWQFTPLHEAARVGSKKIVKYLLDNGADNTCKNIHEETAADSYHYSNSKFAEYIRSYKYVAIQTKGVHE